MKKRKAKFVTISALALSAAPINSARAQLQLFCSQALNVGGHAACGNGALTINPNGTTSRSGCLVTTSPVQVAKCVVQTGGTPITKNVLVEFALPLIKINSGGKTVTIDQLRMQHAGATSPKLDFTFTPTEVANQVFLKIGGRMNFSDNQAIGIYTGTISITAVLQ